MESNNTLFSLNIDPVTKAHLNDTARWARFLALAGMVLLSLAVLFSVLLVTIWSGNSAVRYTINGRETEPSAAVRITYMLGAIVVMVIAFFPLFYLLQFAGRVRKALQANDQENLNIAFLNLKKYFRYLGIMLILFLCFYAIVFVFTLMFNV